MAVRELQEQPEKVIVDKPSKGATEVSGGPNAAKVASAAPDAADYWYNYGPASNPRHHPPVLGLVSRYDKTRPEGKRNIINPLQDQPFTNDVFESFLITMNKRLIKNWMGIAKYYFKDSDEQTRRTLYSWFKAREGQEHFRKWCQQLGKQTGQHPDPKTIKDKSKAPKDAHYPGKAIDVNYDINPWCPIYSSGAKKMIGEALKKEKLDLFVKKKGDYEALLKRCGRIYDRALRLFVPVVENDGSANQPAQAGPEVAVNFSIKYFAEQYYRNNYDWKQNWENAAKPPFSAHTVYKNYQILNLSLRLYFHYLFGGMSKHRKDTKMTKDKKGVAVEVWDMSYNLYGEHTKKTVDDVMAAIRSDCGQTDRVLPQSSQMLLEEEIFIGAGSKQPSPDIRFFEKLSNIVHPYDATKRTLYRYKFNDAQNTDEATLRTVVGYMVKQIEKDHEDLSYGMMLYDINTRRDPCNGIFNMSYETFLAFCYLPADAENLRAFGAFVPGAAGDMQHFDYSHMVRGKGGSPGTGVTLNEKSTHDDYDKYIEQHHYLRMRELLQDLKKLKYKVLYDLRGWYMADTQTNPKAGAFGLRPTVAMDAVLHKNEGGNKLGWLVSETDGECGQAQITMAATEDQYRLILKTVGLEIKDYRGFRDAVGERESSDNYGIVNSSGYMGRYQFGMARLSDFHLTKLLPGKAKSDLNEDYEWINGNSRENFLKDPDLQDDIFLKHVKNLARWANNKWSGNFGQVIQLKTPYQSAHLQKQISEVALTLSGIVGASHLVGPGNAEKFVTGNGEKDPVDGNKTHASEYAYLFGGYDLNEMLT
jgi:hypothetical protein